MRRRKEKRRVLWNGKYKPHYKITYLEPYIEEEITIRETYKKWLIFKDKMYTRNV